jgi:alpha-glucosidase
MQIIILKPFLLDGTYDPDNANICTGTSNFTTLMWSGDQNVDWSTGDGLPSVIPAALSSGLCGIGMTHIDIGLYTTFGALGLKRSAELLLRSAEMAVFSPVMRTHEGLVY